jgi:hypothetical protein
LLLPSDPAAAQSHIEGEHGDETPPIAEVWDAFVSACEALLADPNAYVESHPTVGPDGEQIVHSSPDGRAMVLAQNSPSGIYHEMELIWMPDELHIYCQVRSEPSIDSLMDLAVYGQLTEQSDSELRALIAELDGSTIVGGRMSLEGLASTMGLGGPVSDYYAYILGIQTTFGGERRFVHTTVNGRGASFVGHYVVPADQAAPVVTEAPLQQAQVQPEPVSTPQGEEAAMRAVVELCLRNYRTPDSAIPAFQALGLTLVPGMDEGSWEFSGQGVSGIVSAEAELYCSIQSQHVPLDVARAIGADIASDLFADLVHQGAPEGGTGPCDGLSIFAPRQLIWLRYAQAGNSGECIDDGTSSIIIN